MTRKRPARQLGTPPRAPPDAPAGRQERVPTRSITALFDDADISNCLLAVAAALLVVGWRAAQPHSPPESRPLRCGRLALTSQCKNAGCSSSYTRCSATSGRTTRWGPPSTGPRSRSPRRVLAVLFPSSFQLLCLPPPGGGLPAARWRHGDAIDRALSGSLRDSLRWAMATSSLGSAPPASSVRRSPAAPPALGPLGAVSSFHGDRPRTPLPRSRHLGYLRCEPQPCACPPSLLLFPQTIPDATRAPPHLRSPLLPRPRPLWLP